VGAELWDRAGWSLTWIVPEKHRHRAALVDFAALIHPTNCRSFFSEGTSVKRNLYALVIASSSVILLDACSKNLVGESEGRQEPSGGRPAEQDRGVVRAFGPPEGPTRPQPPQTGTPAPTSSKPGEL
jgi:hypothetical protein